MTARSSEPSAVVDLSPITADDVAMWFATAMKRGAKPDAETCAHLAAMLCKWQPGGRYRSAADDKRWPHVPQLDADAAARNRWDKAAGTLRTEIRKRRREVETAGTAPVSMLMSMYAMGQALDDAALWFGWGPRPKPRSPIWHEPAGRILGWAQSIISWYRPKQAGAGRAGSAAAFTLLALERLGYKGATAAAIASLAEGRKAGDVDLPK